VGSKRLH